MGDVLAKIYKIIESEGGVQVRLKFAQKTGVSQNQAKTIEDKPEYIDRFKKIASELLGKDISSYL